MTGRAGSVVAEAVHVDIDEFVEFADQVLDVDTGPSIDVGREFTGQDRGMHVGNLSSPPAGRSLNPPSKTRSGRRDGHGVPAGKPLG